MKVTQMSTVFGPPAHLVHFEDLLVELGGERIKVVDQIGDLSDSPISVR